MMLGIDIMCNLARIYQCAIHVTVKSRVARRVWQNLTDGKDVRIIVENNNKPFNIIYVECDEGTI